MNYERWWEKGWFWSGIFAGAVFSAMAALAGYLFDLHAAGRFWAAAIAFPVGAALEWLNIGARQIGAAVGAVGLVGVAWFFMGGAGVALPGNDGPGISESVNVGSPGAGPVRSSPVRSGSGGGSGQVNTGAAPSGGSSDGTAGGGMTASGAGTSASDGGAANASPTGGGGEAGTTGATGPSTGPTARDAGRMAGTETEAEEELGPLAEHFLEVRNPADYPVDLTYDVEGEERRLGELGAGSTRLFRVVGRSGGYISFVAESASGRSTTRVRLSDDVGSVTLR